MQQRRFERSRSDSVFAGVCGGVAEYLQIDSWIVRAFFVILGLITAGFFILAYIALLIVMPLPGQRPPIEDVWPTWRSQGLGASEPAPGAVEGSDPSGTTATARPSVARDPVEAQRRMSAAGYVLVALGFVFLLGNLGAFRFFRWDITWPAVLIAIGVLLLVRRTR